MIKNTILLLLFGFYCLNTFAQTDSTTLKVLSWNIYMLPSITNLSKQIKKSDKNKRAKAIAEVLSNNNYDILIFQEAFHTPSRKILRKGLDEEFPYSYGPINKAFLKTNSGIFIMSKIPLQQLDKIIYKKCNAEDCWAKKGSAVLEGSKNGKTFQILGTHLNSTSVQITREAQYEQLYNELLQPYQQNNIPQIICGDMNTAVSNKEAYQSMLKKLDAEDIATQSQQKMTTVKNTAIIDYILLRKNKAQIKTLDKQIRIFKAPFPVIPKLRNTLSDHLAVEVLFKL